MARQIDSVDVVIRIYRDPTTSLYIKQIAGVNAICSDPVASAAIDQGPFVGFPIGLSYMGTTTVDDFLDTALADANAAAGIP